QVQLKGQAKNVNQLIRDYDLFLFPSRWEGFGIALVEAMAAGLPCLVSDLPVLREVAQDAAMYFNPDQPEEAFHTLKAIKNQDINLDVLIKKSSKRAQVFNRQHYMDTLRKLYG
ncbi:MAG: glycosyltransferase, partial [Bacteroidota bacterium]